MRVYRTTLAFLATLLLATPVAGEQILGAGRITDANKVVLPGGPTLGLWQNGKFTSQPDVLQIQGSGSTGDVSGMSVTPNAGAVSGSLARTLYGPTFPGTIKSGVAAAPVFTEAGGVLGRGFIFDSGGSADTPGTVTIPAGKQIDVMGWRETNISAGAGSRASWLNFDLTTSGGDASTNLYGVIGALRNSGPGATKALYGRSIANAGSTGVVVGGVLAAETRAGVNASYGLEMTNDSADGTPITAGIIMDSNRNGSGVVVPYQYGLLLTKYVSIPAGGAAVQANAIGAGNFLAFKNAGGTVNLFGVDSTGAVTAPSFTVNSGGVAVAGTAVTLPVQGSVTYANGNRTWQSQAVTTGDRWRLLAGGVGDVLSIDVNGNFGIGGATPKIAPQSGTNVPITVTGLGTSGALTGAFIRTADPTATDIPTGQCADWNNTTAGTFKHVCNFGGTLRSVTMN